MLIYEKPIAELIALTPAEKMMDGLDINPSLGDWEDSEGDF